jgi:hypothetical protein
MVTGAKTLRGEPRVRIKALKVAAAAAAAVSIAGLAASAHALEFAAYTPDNDAVYWQWSDTGATGTLATKGTGEAVDFNFLLPGYTTPTSIAANFTFLGDVTTPTPAVCAITCQQLGLNGSFDFVATAPFTIGTTTYAANTSLLHGTFTNAWIQGAFDSGSVNATTQLAGGTVHYTSSVIPLLAGAAAPRSFALTLLDVSPGFSAAPGNALTTFSADGTGNFSIGAAVPEPATWALMVLGFGGLGATLRSRRRQPGMARA